MLRRPICGLDPTFGLKVLGLPVRGLCAERGLFPSFGLGRDFDGPAEVNGRPESEVNASSSLERCRESPLLPGEEGFAPLSGGGKVTPFRILSCSEASR